MGASEQPASAAPAASAAHSEEEQRRTREWLERVEGRRGQPGVNYWRMWPILVAPLIPLYGLALPKHPRLRIGLQAATGAGVLLYGFGWAISGSSKVTGG